MSANAAKAASLARFDALLAQILDDACDPNRRHDAIRARASCIRQCAELLAAIAEMYEAGVDGHTEADGECVWRASERTADRERSLTVTCTSAAGGPNKSGLVTACGDLVRAEYPNPPDAITREPS